MSFKHYKNTSTEISTLSTAIFGNSKHHAARLHFADEIKKLAVEAQNRDLESGIAAEDLVDISVYEESIVDEIADSLEEIDSPVIKSAELLDAGKKEVRDWLETSLIPTLVSSRLDCLDAWISDAETQIENGAESAVLEILSFYSKTGATVTLSLGMEKFKLEYMDPADL